MNILLQPETTADPPVESKPGEPGWNIALLHPRQGEWTEAEYLALDTNRQMAFVDGTLEFLPTYFYYFGPASRFPRGCCWCVRYW